MRTVLIVVATTLAVVIAVVAGVYGWMLLTAPPPSDRLPPPPAKKAAAARPPVRTPPKSADTSASKPRRPLSNVPPKDAVFPAPPPPTYVAGEKQEAVSPPPGTVQPEGEAPEVAPEPMEPGSLGEKLYTLQIGLSETDVDGIMGQEGTPDAGASQGEFIPQGWYALRWSDPDGGSITGLFNDAGYLVHLEPFKIPGAIDWMNADPYYSITTWLNDNFKAATLPVRLPAVDVVATSSNTYQYQAGLVNSTGQVVGSVAGAYYVGDGQTTYIPGDSQPYSRAIEGSYQFTGNDGTPQGSNFGLVER